MASTALSRCELAVLINGSKCEARVWTIQSFCGFMVGRALVSFLLPAIFRAHGEEYFTVMQWDQRGAGKTYASNDKELQHRTMTMAQMRQHTVDVVNYLCHRFHGRRII